VKVARARGIREASRASYNTRHIEGACLAANNLAEP
jgi:hypothetical protein